MTKLPSFTPGPWTHNATGCQPGAFSVEGNGQLTALVYGATREQQKANAHLIASAPDLLSALKAAVEQADSNLGNFSYRDDECQRIYEQCVAAIAKAIG